LREDDKGLHVEALLRADDPDVQRLIPKYQRGDLREMSFAFRCNDDKWDETYSRREIREADIHRGDVSIVTYGASPTTESTLRSEEAALELRSVGAAGLIGSLQDFAFTWVANYLGTHGERATIERLEARAGKVLSSQSLETLRKVLDLVSTADECVDEAQPLLADLMGVPNPDGDDDGSDAAPPDRPANLAHLSADDADQEERETEESQVEGRDYWETNEWRRQFSGDERQRLAKSGAAMSDGSYPIVNKSDLENAIRAYGRAPESKRAAVKAHIKKRAAALGATDMLPDDWRIAEAPPEVRYDDLLDIAVELAVLGARRR
jgi:hypothetical protein